MIPGHTAGPTTRPPDSRNPAIRPDAKMPRTVGDFHTPPFTVGTPCSVSHAASDHRLSPARYRAANARTISASDSCTVTWSGS